MGKAWASSCSGSLGQIPEPLSSLSYSRVGVEGMCSASCVVSPSRESWTKTPDGSLQTWVAAPGLLIPSVYILSPF